MNAIKVIILICISAVFEPYGLAVEKSDFQKKLLVKYDANKDGRLSTIEREKIRYDKLNPPKTERRRSERRQFRYPDPIITKFDVDKDSKLNGQEFSQARQWVDRRFKEINDEYDINKDGRLNTSERAAIAKEVEEGKFKTMDWLMKYITRPPSRSRDRNRDMREEPRERERLKVFLKSDIDKDGLLSEEELNSARAAFSKGIEGKQK
jgi:hypothetical protein